MEELSGARKRAADAAMDARDRRERSGRTQGSRATRRDRAPQFLASSDDDMDDTAGGLLAGIKPRARRQYDERREIDDAEGAEEVSTLSILDSGLKSIYRKYPSKTWPISKPNPSRNGSLPQASERPLSNIFDSSLPRMWLTAKVYMASVSKYSANVCILVPHLVS